MAFSLVMSMSSSSFSVSNLFRSSRYNSIFFDSICVVSTLGGLLLINVFLSTSMSSLMLLITFLWSLPILTWSMTVTSVWPIGLYRSMLTAAGWKEATPGERNCPSFDTVAVSIAIH